MPVIELSPERLSKESFASFGDVIEVIDTNTIIPINYGLTERHEDLAHIDVSDQDGEISVSIFRSRPVTLPFEVKVMERHPLGSQAFVNLREDPYLILVAPAGDFDHKQLRAFRAEPGQGINYRKGVWHHYCLAIERTTEFLVIDRVGEGKNLDEIFVPKSVTIRLI